MKLQQHQEEKSKTLDLKSILKDTYGTLAEFTCIKNELEQLQQSYTDSGIPEIKEELMGEMAQPGFWQSEQRQDVLSQIEYFDRFNAAFDTSKKLLQRLEDPEKVRLNYDPSLLKKLAQRIYLLQASLTSYQGKEPQDALVRISSEEQDADWGKRITGMYHDWARRRKMNVERVYAGEDEGDRYTIYHFSGFGCYSILKNEHGIHLKEKKPSQSRMVEKSRVRVSVLPLDSSEYHLLEQPAELLDRFRTHAAGQVVRRFNMEHQQCKDVVNKWQTGLVEKVLKGLFDVM